MLLYYGYTWASNYYVVYAITYTYGSSVTMHKSPLFYLIIFGCAGGAFVIDLFVETIKVNLLGRPSSYIRSKLNTGHELTPEIIYEFENLRTKREENFIQLDIKREKFNQKAREVRMTKLKQKLEAKQEEHRREMERSHDHHEANV